MFSIYAQSIDNKLIKERIESYKKDERGPYKDIRWFCPDSTIVLPKDRCDQPGGVQRARYKDEVESLALTNHIYFGQILSNTPYDEFLDAEYSYSRLKQYQLEKYLRSIDNGWISRRAQFYRGAFQSEDEENWGKQFYLNILKNNQLLISDYFIIRQSLKDIPHKGDDNLAQLIRNQSKVISDIYEPFVNLRVKIHGQPEESDLIKVKLFLDSNHSKIDQDLINNFEELIATMEKFYQPIDVGEIRKLTKSLSSATDLKSKINKFSSDYEKLDLEEKISENAELLFYIRLNLVNEKNSESRLSLLDISLLLEEISFKEIAKWKPGTLSELTNKINTIALLSVATGYLELWEWYKLKSDLSISSNQPSLPEMNQYLTSSRKVVEWGVGLVKVHYQDVTNRFSGFEPLANGFIDDRIRSSPLLHLGRSIAKLGDLVAEQSGFSNKVLGIANQSDIRGLNPGYAKGELVVISGSPDEIEVENNKIYIIERPPSDLKPIAGIATVSEGNLVSHVQLLARNLGIPNAVVSQENLVELKAYHGKEIFYAVSNRGTVIMKLATTMTLEEQALFSVNKRSEDKITVPVSQVNLQQTTVVNLRDVGSDESGKLCGPKAANLGQLKRSFPNMVVEGFVIPFGIFYEHMQQEMPNTEGTYWQFLQNVYQKAENMRISGSSDAIIEDYTLKQLEVLKNAIKLISLLPSFEANLKAEFRKILGKPLGEVPVFLRSDTNMEDLKDFTGAGLNLTLFNTVSQKDIIQGIKDVWASPYSERSFKWRQKYLLNPENVYPSILVIPSVNVDYSGVLITKGIVSGDINELTVAMSRGAGGAVDGQVSESYLIRSDGTDKLLSPARELYFNSLPESGGIKKLNSTFETPILSRDNINSILELSDRIKSISQNDSSGPFDVEFGFKNNEIWLFQIRPFVENKKALKSTYLESITPEISQSKTVPLSTKIIE